MTKFNLGTVRARVNSPLRTAKTPSGTTFEGHVGYARDTKSALFLLACSNFVNENSFYEAATVRDSRFTDLVRKATVEDPEWTADLLRWLRADGNMRTASLVGAAEYTKAALEKNITGSRAVVSSVLQRADEPGEMLAYWTSHYGRAIPKPVKRGTADAVLRLYTERGFLRYDSDAKGYQFADVIDLVHPATDKAWQGDLFKYALDRRHKRDNPIPESLRAVRARRDLSRLDPAARHEFMRLVQGGDAEAREKFQLAMASQWEWARSWLGE